MASPDTVGPTDSAIVVCNATDIDGDVLVYDWATDDRLRIKGSVSGIRLSGTAANSVVVYHGPITNPVSDSAFVLCSARDPSGAITSVFAYIVVHD